jgi:hypothetical protein
MKSPHETLHSLEHVCSDKGKTFTKKSRHLTRHHL